LRQIFGARVLTEHLQNGIARHDVNQQEDHRKDEPQRGQRVEEPKQDVSNHSVFRAFSAIGFVSGADAGTGGSPGCFSRWILIRATRRRSISTTVKRCPS